MQNCFWEGEVLIHLSLYHVLAFLFQASNLKFLCLDHTGKVSLSKS